jgi:hypothetical protein
LAKGRNSDDGEDGAETKPLPKNLARLAPEELAALVHGKLGPRVQKDISVGDVKAVIGRLKWDSTKPSRPVPHLLVRRLRFKGEKRLAGQDPSLINYDQSFFPGVNLILMADRNMVGKSSILKTIKFALTGDNEDYDKDVKGWIKEIWLEFSLGAREFTVILAHREDDWHGVIATASESRTLEEVVERLPRKDQHHVGLPAIQEALAQLFFREYSLSSLGWTQARADGEVVECTTSWQTYFQAMRIRDDDHKFLICEPVAGLANQEQLLFMAFLGLHLAEPLNQLGVEQSTLKKSQSVSDKEAEALRGERDKLQGEMKGAQKRLTEIEQAQRRRQQDVLNGDLPTLIATAEGEQLQKATEITELIAQQTDLGTKAQKARAQAKRIQTYIELQCEFSGIDVTLCPRCTKSIDSASIERETDTHECRLCNKTATTASEDDIERLKFEAADWDAEAKRNQDAQTQVGQRIAALKAQENGLKKRADELRASIKAGVSAAYPTPEEDAEKAKLNESLGRIGHQLWHVEQRLGSASGGSEDAEKRAKIVKKIREVLRDEAERRNAAINKRLDEMTQAVTTAIGAKNITGISCSPLGSITLFKNDEEVTLSGLKNPGERFRIKLALFLAMMQLGREEGFGRHPGFLLIDQLGAAEMAHGNMNASAAILKSIDDNLADRLQIICTTARAEFSGATDPKKISGTKVKAENEEYAF